MMEKRTTSFKLGFFVFFLQTNRRSHRSQWVLHYCYSAVFHVSYLLLWCPQTDEKKESIHNCDFKKNTPDGTWLKLSENQMLFWRLLVINMNRSCTNTHRSTFTQLIFLQLNIILLLMNFLLLLTLWLQLSSSSLDFRLSALEQQRTARLD